MCEGGLHQGHDVFYGHLRSQRPDAGNAAGGTKLRSGRAAAANVRRYMTAHFVAQDRKVFVLDVSLCLHFVYRLGGSYVNSNVNTPAYRPLKSRTASSIATMFSTGVPAWTL